MVNTPLKIVVSSEGPGKGWDWRKTWRLQSNDNVSFLNWVVTTQVLVALLFFVPFIFEMFSWQISILEQQQKIRLFQVYE